MGIRGFRARCVFPAFALLRPAASWSLPTAVPCALLLPPLTQPAFLQRNQDQSIQSTQHHQKLTHTGISRGTSVFVSFSCSQGADFPGQLAAHAGYISRATPWALAASVSICFASSSRPHLSLRLDREQAREVRLR